MKVLWSPEAEDDLIDICSYIAADNPSAADRMQVLFIVAAERLMRFPKKGRVGNRPGTREIIPHKAYRMIYEIQGEEVRILAIVHTARLWPP